MLDKVTIRVKAGDGGPGAVAFHREKFVPLGGPDGGDGGKGGDVIIKADPCLSHLSNFRYRKDFKAADGGAGGKNRMSGRNGADTVLTVPVGTVVVDKNPAFDSFATTDLREAGQEIVVARGGKGGMGNQHFASSTNQTPRLAQAGAPGEEREVVLELRIIADVGIIGYPNVGKSSLLAAASAAHPKIADYPFTTLEPMLGVVTSGRCSFVLAEIPGLIAGAAQGKGLGHEFLRHVVRTRVLIHLIDGTSPHPVEDMLAVNNELALFDPALSRKPQLVALNKVDKPEVKERERELKKLFKEAGIATVSFISAATGAGVPGLLARAAEYLAETAPPEAVAEAPLPVLRPQPRGKEVGISKVGGAYILSAPDLERLVAGSDINNPEVRRQLGAILLRPRLRHQLERAGVQPGDRVRVGDFEWTW